MDINQIILPLPLMESLYQNLLVENASAMQPVHLLPEQKATKKTIQYLGKNQKNVCLLVNYAHDVHLPDNELHFLTTILQACKLNLGDVAIVNLHQQKTSFTQLKEILSCRYLLLFGIDPLSVGLEDIPLFTTAVAGDCAIVCSPAAEELNSNQPQSKGLKTKLWLCLKQLFAV